MLDLSTGAMSDSHAFLAWFCVRTHNKLEHLAAAYLRQDPDIEVFLPRIRSRRITRCGPVWRTEALFLNYIFAKFDLAARLRRVQHARAVRGVVHFGNRWPFIPAPEIEALRQAVGEEEVLVISDEVEVGEPVVIASGPFNGLEAVVSRVMPGPQRVALLLDFLGRQTVVEMSRTEVVPQASRLFPACAGCA